ncbi:hypothetical protein [Exiguobacterium sp. ZOR0005]|uniref:hypothetical protein n=1 Tax=Exiguobacterium sp. ZOR0005 TaxID=1339226 RepID=UPI0012E091AF|nr:hypothetical protein [Exiguobacterium sp. ZOR0005]
MLVKIYKYAFILLIFTTFVFMTGSLYGIDIKLFLAGVSSFALIVILYSQKKTINKFNLALLVSFFVLYFFSALIGILKGFNESYVLGELIGLLSPILVIALYRSDFVSIITLKKTMLYGAFTYSLLKVMAATLISTGVLSFTTFFNTIETIFGYRLVSMLISQEYNIVRIYIVNDLLIAFTPIILFSAQKVIKSKILITITYITLLLSMLLCYSRFLLVIYLIASLLPFFSIVKLNINKVIISVFTLGFSLIYLTINGLPESISKRFSTSDINNISSDGIRNEQFEAIVKMISENLFLGAGIGSYSSQYIRTEYIYELQWLSMVFKFGFPAFIILVTLILLYLNKNFKINYKSLISISLLLSSGLFNPYLQSTVMGVAMLLMYSEYHLLESKEKEVTILRSLEL